MAGIVAKIWNISAGTKNRGPSVQISDSINYIFNPEKCSQELSSNAGIQIKQELSYITNDVKTLKGLFVGSRNILNIDHALEEMIALKKYHGKMDKRIALHGVISLDDKDSDEKNAGKLLMLADVLMREVFPDNQVVYAVHTNTEHLHVHFIANTVGLSGKKIHMDQDFMKKVFQKTINRLAQNYGFLKNEEWEKEKEKVRVPIAEQKIKLRNIIDWAIEESEDVCELMDYFRKYGLVAYVGNSLFLKTDEMNEAMNSSKLGSVYSFEKIMERMRTKRDRFTQYQMKYDVGEINEKDIYYIPSVLKKYKDMDVSEKKETISLLRQGKNPWKMKVQNNWQMKKVGNELVMAMHTYDIVKFYSPTLSLGEAKDKIKEQLKTIREDKKKVKFNLKMNHVQVSIYEQMKELQIGSYLYEKYQIETWREDYEQYKKLSFRLMKEYGKTINDMSDFVEGQKNELLYMKAQEEELGMQYKNLVRYEREKLKRFGEEQSCTIFDAIDHGSAKREAAYGLLRTKMFYVENSVHGDYRLLVLQTPTVKDGKATVKTVIKVLDREENEVYQVDSSLMDYHAFNREISKIKNQYKFEDCVVYEKNDEKFVEKSRHL